MGNSNINSNHRVLRLLLIIIQEDFWTQSGDQMLLNKVLMETWVWVHRMRLKYNKDYNIKEALSALVLEKDYNNLWCSL